MHLTVNDKNRIARYNHILGSITDYMTMPAIIKSLKYASNTTRVDVLNLKELGYIEAKHGERPHRGQSPRMFKTVKFEFDVKHYTPLLSPQRVTQPKQISIVSAVVIEHVNDYTRKVLLADNYMTKGVSQKQSAWARPFNPVEMV